MTQSDTQQRSVAFLGPAFSFSHQATLKEFSPKDGFLLKDQPTIPDVFAAIQSGAATFGVVPYENSTYGSVYQTLDLLADRKSQFSSLAICGEIYLGIHHSLLGFHDTSPSSPPGRKSLNIGKANSTHPNVTPAHSGHPLCNLAHVQHVYSHPQALGQCAAFLSANLRHAQQHESASTSRGAEIAAQDVSLRSTAIASKVIAGSLGLDVLAEGIEDRADNATRFLVLRHGERTVDEKLVPGFLRVSGEEESRGDWRTIVTFQAEQGALAEALGVFKEVGLSLTGLNSRPSHERLWHYVFFVEFEGRLEEDGMGPVRQAIDKLGPITTAGRLWGSWKDRSRLDKSLSGSLDAAV